MNMINFGIITDIHNGKGEPYLDRYLEKAPDKVKKVVSEFNKSDLSFVVNLGDTIDSGFENFHEINKILSALKAPLYQLAGNHDFDVSDKEKANIYKTLNIQNPYYEIIKEPFQFLFLDGNEISLYATPSFSKEYARSLVEFKRLQSLNKVNAKEYNGGISIKQLNWVNEKLKKSKQKGLNSIIFCHFPIFPPDELNLLNDNELLKLIGKYKHVKAWICGHNHQGNYGKINNCHVVNLRALVNTPVELAYSIVSLSAHKIVVKGFGREIDRELEI